jgi:hypothetical protein
MIILTRCPVEPDRRNRLKTRSFLGGCKKPPRSLSETIEALGEKHGARGVVGRMRSGQSFFIPYPDQGAQARKPRYVYRTTSGKVVALTEAQHTRGALLHLAPS